MTKWLIARGLVQKLSFSKIKLAYVRDGDNAFMQPVPIVSFSASHIVAHADSNFACFSRLPENAMFPLYRTSLKSCLDVTVHVRLSKSHSYTPGGVNFASIRHQLMYHFER